MSSFECNGRNRKYRSLPWEAISLGKLQKNAGGRFENGASPPHSFWLLAEIIDLRAYPDVPKNRIIGQHCPNVK
jgi:hypothetical protein